MVEDRGRARATAQRSAQAPPDHARQPSDQAEAAGAAPATPFYPPSLLADARWRGRGNGAARTALLLQMQQTQGNRAVQRLVARQRAGPVPLQRCGGAVHEGCACAGGAGALEDPARPVQRAAATSAAARGIRVLQREAASGLSDAGAAGAGGGTAAAGVDTARLAAKQATAGQLAGDRAATAPQEIGQAAAAQVHSAVNVVQVGKAQAPALPPGGALPVPAGLAAQAGGGGAGAAGAGDAGPAASSPEALQGQMAATQATYQAKAAQAAAAGQQVRAGGGDPHGAPVLAAAGLTGAEPAAAGSGGESTAAAQARVRAEFAGETTAMTQERTQAQTSSYQALLAVLPAPLLRQAAAAGHQAPAPPPAAAAPDFQAPRFHRGSADQAEVYVGGDTPGKGGLSPAKAALGAKLQAAAGQQQARFTAIKTQQGGRVEHLAAAKRAAAYADKGQKESAARAHAGQQQQQALAAGQQQQDAARADAASKQTAAEQTAAARQESIEAQAAARIAQLTQAAQQQVTRVLDQVRGGAEQIASRAEQTVAGILEHGRQQSEQARAEAQRMQSGSVVDQAVDAIRAGVNRLLTAARDLWDRAVASARQAVSAAEGAIDRLREQGARLLGQIGTGLQADTGAVLSGRASMLGAVGNWLVGAIKTIVNAVVAAVKWVVKFVVGLITWIVLLLSTVLMAIVTLVVAILWGIAWLLHLIGIEFLLRWMTTALKFMWGIVRLLWTLVTDPFTSGCDPEKKKILETAIAEAPKLGRTALGKLVPAAAMDATTKANFAKFFEKGRPAIDDAHVKAAAGVLSEAIAGIEGGPKDVSCDDSASPQCEGADAFAEKSSAYYAPWASMHFCSDIFKRPERYIATVVIHEATHKFAGTADHAYDNDVFALDSDAALDNADSYREFVDVDA